MSDQPKSRSRKGGEGSEEPTASSMNYTRKRALLACDFCRHRKRRCDGQRPCSTCKDSNADCVYKELPYDRIEDASPTAVVDRLARIEALLEQQSQQLHHLSTSSTPTPVPQSRPDYFASQLFPSSHAYHDSGSISADSTNENTSFLIPKGHTTVASTLLSVPNVQALLGEYPRDFFYDVEASMPPPEVLEELHQGPTSWPPLRRENLEALADSYFLHHHPQFPLFGPQTFKVWHKRLLENGPAEDIETAICLSVYAVGALVSRTADTEAKDQAIALSFFKPALRIITHHNTWGFRPKLEVCQALLLAAAYFIHLGRPLHCWRMVYCASQKFLQYMDVHKRHFPYTDCTDAELRVFWLCFMIESNRVAELDVPRSGIEPLGDKMPLPNNLELRHDDDAILFIAEMAVRRLLNRIHSSLYSPDSTESNSGSGSVIDPTLMWQGFNLQRLLALSGELNRQLEEWYASMPDDVRPPRGTRPIASQRRRILRIRYYAAQHIIHRPFVLHTVVQQQVSRASTPPGMDPDLYAALPQVVIDQCQICIDSCLNYLYNAVEMLDMRSPYLWSFSQSSMACLIILMIAEGCPPLRKFVPKVQPIRDLVVGKLSKWATKGSTFEAEVAIMQNLVFDGTPSA